jgi:hypothetical protein
VRQFNLTHYLAQRRDHHRFIPHHRSGVPERGLACLSAPSVSDEIVGVLRWPWFGVEGDLAVSVPNSRSPPAAGETRGKQLPGQGDFLDDVAAGFGVAEKLTHLVCVDGHDVVFLTADDSKHPSVSFSICT